MNILASGHYICGSTDDPSGAIRMAQTTSPMLRQLRRAALGAQGGGFSDGQLLRAFLHNHDECAFEALVRRHGPMVLGVCRRVLRDAHDAEDAFQAAFLVLVRRATSLAGQEIIGAWLHEVALRTALKARSAIARRRGKERRMARPELAPADLSPEWHALLDQELNGLPEKYRVPIILCELQGRTHQEAARRLGCPIGTLSGRLSRARTLLARRLARRGLTISAAALAASLCPDATATPVSTSLLGSIVKAATCLAAGQTAAGVVSTQVVALTEGVVRAMLLHKLKALGAVVLVLAFLGAGTGFLRTSVAADEPKPQPKGVLPEPRPGPAQRIRPKVPPPAAGLVFDIELQIRTTMSREMRPPQTVHLRTEAGVPAQFLDGAEMPVKLGEKLVMVPSGISVKIIADPNPKGGIDVDLTASKDHATIEPGDQGASVHSESVRVVRKAELEKPVSVELESKDENAPAIEIKATISAATEISIAAAERDFKVAQFYRKNGRIDSAVFVYELILRRYPNTLYAEQAKERIQELKKEHPVFPPEKAEPDSIGEVRLINHTKLEDKLILDKLALHPGELFTWQRLLKSEWKFLESGLFTNPPKILITYEESKTNFKDLNVKIEE
jgi:RNA polymerase sigma factor (sigma-70 family)